MFKLFAYNQPTRLSQILSVLLAVILHLALVLVFFILSSTQNLLLNLDLPIINLEQITIGSSAAANSEAASEQRQAASMLDSKKVFLIPKLSALEKIPTASEQARLTAERKAKEEAERKAKEAAKLKAEEAAREAKEEAERKAKAKAEAELAAALKEADKKAKAFNQKQAADNLASALQSAASNTEIVEGAQGDGIGILGLYQDSIISRIRPHFITAPRSDGVVFRALVELIIAPDGTITEVKILEPSEDSTFNSNVLRAISNAGKMEAPPNKDMQEIQIWFSSQM